MTSYVTFGKLSSLFCDSCVKLGMVTLLTLSGCSVSKMDACELLIAHHVTQILADVVPGFSPLLSFLGIIIEGMATQKSSLSHISSTQGTGIDSVQTQGKHGRSVCVSSTGASFRRKGHQYGHSHQGSSQTSLQGQKKSIFSSWLDTLSPSVPPNTSV